MKNWLIILNLIVIIFGSTGFAGEDWQLYDDFSSGAIDTGKWSVDDSSATISIDNGRAKFVHSGTSGQPDSSWLEFKNPAMIAGIKATITVEACDGDALRDIPALQCSYSGYPCPHTGTWSAYYRRITSQGIEEIILLAVYIEVRTGYLPRYPCAELGVHLGQRDSVQEDPS